jgi:hypothetical protein
MFKDLPILKRNFFWKKFKKELIYKHLMVSASGLVERQKHVLVPGMNQDDEI